MWSDAARQASAAARRAMASAHQSGIAQAMRKDRFTGLVPPGSKRDFMVKQAASWAGAGLAHGTILALGGGPVGVAGQAVASYTKWGGDLVRKFGPGIRARFAA